MLEKMLQKLIGTNFRIMRKPVPKCCVIDVKDSRYGYFFRRERGQRWPSLITAKPPSEVSL